MSLLAADSPDSTTTDPVHPANLLVGLAAKAVSWLDAANGGVGAAQVPVAVDAALGVTQVTLDSLSDVARQAYRLSSPVLAFLARPPLVPLAYQPATIAEDLARRGRRYRDSCEPSAATVSAALARRLVNEVLDCLDLTAVVLDRVDLEAIIASVDIEAVVRRVDLTRLVLDLVDLDAIVATVDVEAVVRRLDLTRLVLDLVDLDAIVATVDIEAIVARVNVNGVADRVDITPIIDRIDLVGLASYVIDEIDLPGVIRESTSGVASEAVRGVRMQSIDADQAVQRTIDRMLLRRRARATAAPGAETFEVPEASGVPQEPVGARTDR
jgi:hypothetical protein